MIALLNRAGKTAEVITEYERLVRLAPGEARYPLELAELYHRRGEKARALALIRRPAGEQSQNSPGGSSQLGSNRISSGEPSSRWIMRSLTIPHPKPDSRAVR